MPARLEGVFAGAARRVKFLLNPDIKEYPANRMAMRKPLASLGEILASCKGFAICVSALRRRKAGTSRRIGQRLGAKRTLCQRNADQVVIPGGAKTRNPVVADRVVTGFRRAPE
jgi:hypothetical protein